MTLNAWAEGFGSRKDSARHTCERPLNRLGGRRMREGEDNECHEEVLGRHG